MLVTVRYISGTHDIYDMNKDELETFSKWLLDDNSNNIYAYERLHCDNGENVYIYEKKKHTCYIFKEKIEYVHIPTN
jgi:hypothetical protein